MRSSQRPTVLVVDDEPLLRRALERDFNRAGYSVRCVGTIEEGRSVLAETGVDVAFVDVQLPDGNGTELIKWAVAHNRAQAVYCMTAYASCRTAVEVMQAGCVDVLEKPFDVGMLTELVAGQTGDGAGGLARWRTRYASRIVGQSKGLMDALDVVRGVSDTDCTVLITGESGTGKELLARAVHEASERHEGPFVALNCAAIPDSMVEAELFGHARGAFTGAVGPREGRIAAAHKGTLFLDEIGDMPLAAQAKLLRVLEQREVMPVGSDVPRHIDMRVLAATNQDLPAMVEEGTFRVDLYYRLNVIAVHIPPLRDRGDDIILLAESFLRTANERNKRQVTGFEPEAVQALCAYAWPGNVRELAHTIERAVLLKRAGRLAMSDLRLPGGAPSDAAAVDTKATTLDLRGTLEQVERRLIEEALERTGGNRTEAAALLGVNRTTLVEKIRKYSD